MNRRRNCAQRNSISFEELKLMNKDQCVKVSLSYLYILVAKCLSIQIGDDNVMEILKKYLDVITMQEYIGEKDYSYCLMKVSDILFLISTLNAIPPGKVRVFKNNNAITFEEYYETLKEEYLAKVLEMNLEIDETYTEQDNDLIRSRIH